MLDAAPPRYRIGMIVPSSNVTMETEVPQLLRRQRGADGGFSFHSARLRLREVTPEALEAMNQSAADAVDALADAQCDAMVYACLVALMAGGRARIDETRSRLAPRSPARLVTSADALVTALRALGATKVTLIAPYRKALTAQVESTLAAYGIEVLDTRSLEVVDNTLVGRLDPARLLEVAADMDHSKAQALVISACVQMPSLAVVEAAEQRFGRPVLSAATASVYTLLQELNIRPAIAGAGSLLRKEAA